LTFSSKQNQIPCQSRHFITDHDLIVTSQCSASRKRHWLDLDYSPMREVTDGTVRDNQTVYESVENIRFHASETDRTLCNSQRINSYRNESLALDHHFTCDNFVSLESHSRDYLTLALRALNRSSFALACQRRFVHSMFLNVEMSSSDLGDILSHPLARFFLLTKKRYEI